MYEYYVLTDCPSPFSLTQGEFCKIDADGDGEIVRGSFLLCSPLYACSMEPDRLMPLVKLGCLGSRCLERIFLLLTLVLSQILQDREEMRRCLLRAANAPELSDADMVCAQSVNVCKLPLFSCVAKRNVGRRPEGHARACRLEVPANRVMGMVTLDSGARMLLGRDLTIALFANARRRTQTTSRSR